MEVSRLTDPGNIRVTNEDSSLALEFSFWHGDQKRNFFLTVVADGMGGKNRGDYASGQAVRLFAKDVFGALVSAANYSEIESFQEIVANAIRRANRAIYKKVLANPKLKGMGTTLTAVLVVNSWAYIAHVGHSRIYHFSAGVLEQVTQDHTVAWDLVEQGILTAESARKHPKKKTLTRAIGIQEELEIEVSKLSLDRDDYLLLCTDGLTNLVKDSEIQMILSKSLEHATGEQKTAEAMMLLAKKLGGHDNITLVLCRYTSNLMADIKTITTFGGTDDVFLAETKFE